MNRRVAVIAVAAGALAFGGPAVSWAGGGNSGNAQACQGSGWQTLTHSGGVHFKNAGDCTSWGAHGGAYDSTTST